MAGTQSELRLARLIDEREHTQTLHEGKLADIEKRDDKMPSDADAAQITAYRERIYGLDTEIKDLAESVEHNNKAMEQSQKIRRALAGAGGVDEDGDGVVYRSMAAYARDVIITGNGREAAKIKGILGDNAEVDRAESRLQLLKRTPANTLSSDVAGLIPQQHIAQIFQVINDSRPLVASAQRRTSSGASSATRRSTPGRSSRCRPRRRPRPATRAWTSAWSPRPPAPISAAATCPGRPSTGQRRTRSICGSGWPRPTTR